MKKKFKLPKAKKTKWVNTLKSGKYYQGTDMLISHNKGEQTKHCCLGVAVSCGLTSKGYDADMPGNKSDCHVAISFLPKDIQASLIRKNDALGWNFEQIANWIEKNL